MAESHPTAYPDVNAVLNELLWNAQAILGDQWVGMVLYGSLALGDFSTESSDVDFLVVTAAEPADETVRALAVMHTRIAAIGSKWATELEGSYIPRDALRRYDPSRARHPHIDRGHNGEGLVVRHHDCDWVIQRRTLREHGVVLAGPAPKTMIDPVLPDDLRQATLSILQGWWTLMLDDPAPLRSTGYQAYAVLTMCRMLYTLQSGIIVSKPTAGQWAKAALEERWAGLIERALAWRHGAPFEGLNGTLDFIRYTLETSRSSVR
ncbi:MAG: DUF4111 domain-containing protein [Chloroflexi bacterium]|nr:DUF4111 domain-containing protein [Chloroflexota bacterium]